MVACRSFPRPESKRTLDSGSEFAGDASLSKGASNGRASGVDLDVSLILKFLTTAQNLLSMKASIKIRSDGLVSLH